MFNVSEDRSEMHDLADAHPKKLQQMINMWFAAAGQYHGLPIDDRTAAEQLSGTPRPQMSKPTDRLKFVYSYAGLEEQMIVANQPLTHGEHVLGVSYDNESITPEKHAASGTLTLHIDDQQVGQQKIKTQLAHFSLTGEGFAVGRDAGAPVTGDYAGDHPWAFTGGTIKKVIADVSGEAYVDLEKEALAAMKRD